MIFEHKKMDANEDAYSRHRETQQNNMLSHSISPVATVEKEEKIELALFLLGNSSRLFIFYMLERNLES